MSFDASAFGPQINHQQIVEELSHLKGWENKYRQVIKWGKLLPVMSDTNKEQLVEVAGCESQVWLYCEPVKVGKLSFWQVHADSDARIVRGLIAIVQAAFNGQTSETILGFDVAEYFEKLGLIEHLSPSRGNGLRAIVDQIIEQVEQHQN
ncbi:Fe-S metabolism protein SufE [Vibrio sp. qd031]|uniref:SufE family protein n=1 Tax=Vibrio sp. qd031 TaxID=1603038 RepID=UPI000A102A5F|nr:SufE family protein [Vibrio sp. qd031]ORT49241.1 Fe-S metabolism protein SufE [Vibrio sp. qd031]